MTHTHRWKFKQKSHGVLRYCSCGERVLELSSPKGSFLEDHPTYNQPRVKGKHYKHERHNAKSS